MNRFPDFGREVRRPFAVHGGTSSFWPTGTNRSIVQTVPSGIWVGRAR
jgi:hypothetical protein